MPGCISIKNSRGGDTVDQLTSGYATRCSKIAMDYDPFEAPKRHFFDHPLMPWLIASPMLGWASYQYSGGDYVTAIVFACFSIALLAGWYIGLARSIGTWVMLPLASLSAGYFGPMVAEQISNQQGLAIEKAVPIASVGVFLVSLIAIYFLGFRPLLRIVHRNTALRRCNVTLGAGLAVAKVALLAIVFTSGIVYLDESPNAKPSLQKLAAKSGSQIDIVAGLETTADSIRLSSWGKWTGKMIPWNDVVAAVREQVPEGSFSGGNLNPTELGQGMSPSFMEQIKNLAPQTPATSSLQLPH